MDAARIAFRDLAASLEDSDTRLGVGLGIIACVLAYALLWPSGRPKLFTPDGMHILWGHEKEVFMGKPGVVYKRWINELGRTYRIKAALLMPDIIVLADPAGLSHLLQKKIYDYHHSDLVRPRVERLMGRGLGWVEGEDEHKRMRRMISPSLSPDNLRNMGQLRIMEAASRVLNDMASVVQEMKAEDNVINILEWTNKAALNVIGRVAFHHDFDGGNDEHSKKIFAGRHTGSTQITKFMGFVTLMLLRRFTFLNKLPIKAIQSQANAREAIQSGVAHEFVKYEQGDVSENEKRDRKDLLNRLLTMFGKNELSKDELYAHISTMVIGGQETTSFALTFAVSELSKRPEAQARLQKEVLEFNGEPTYDEFMTRFPYMDAVLKEIMRLYPGLSYMERVATKDDVIPLHYPTKMSDGKEYNHLEIRKGQTVIVPIISIHRLDSLWGADAETFNPDRWLRPLPKDVELYSGWSHLLGFSDGPRACVGMRLAIIEFKVVMFGLFRQFKFEPVDEIIDLKISSSLQPFVRGREAEGPQLPVKVSLL